MIYRLSTLFFLLMVILPGCNNSLRNKNETQHRFLDELWTTYLNHYSQGFKVARQKHTDGDFVGAWAEVLHVQHLASFLVEVAEKYKELPGQDSVYTERSTKAAEMLTESESRVDALRQDMDMFLEAKKQAALLSAVRHQEERTLHAVAKELRERGQAFYNAGEYRRAAQEWEYLLDFLERQDFSTEPDWLPELEVSVKKSLALASSHLDK